ncbi:hypothetical protein B0I03_10211 [Flavobacterium aquaticum]|uniref:Uncharacterized protein n=1 Tax=Flavobacterium aquaticum TaxID=1236486 RepID=A0A327YU68_9FLAO|nr:hypothetical protein [Flavobacterium aquaticum]RAK24162.1 hypothetical protein B0I03_10211 [Flavobacterium aquaticum]
MDKIIVVVLCLLLLLAIILIIANKRIKRMHYHKMNQLKDIFKSLSSKQEILNHKASISNDFQSNYKSDMKKLSEEIFVLQKRIFELLSKK